MSRDLFAEETPDKVAVALQLAARCISPEQVCSEWPELTIEEVEEWCNKAEEAAETAFARRRASRGRAALKVVLVVLAVTSLLGGLFSCIILVGWESSWTIRGQMGDFWGGFLATAASLGGTALFGLAILYQLDELSAQRAELRHTTREMEKGRLIAREQVDLARESAIVTQILECARLAFNAELEHAGAEKHAEEFLALEQIRRSRSFLSFLIERGKYDVELYSQLLRLTAPVAVEEERE